MKLLAFASTALATFQPVSVEQELLAKSFADEVIQQMSAYREHVQGKNERVLHNRAEPNIIRLAFHSCQGGCDADFDRSNPFNKGIEQTSDQLDFAYTKFVELWEHMKTFNEQHVYREYDQQVFGNTKGCLKRIILIMVSKFF